MAPHGDQQRERHRRRRRSWRVVDVLHRCSTAIQDAYVDKLVDTLNDPAQCALGRLRGVVAQRHRVWWNNHQIDHDSCGRPRSVEAATSTPSATATLGGETPTAQGVLNSDADSGGPVGARSRPAGRAVRVAAHRLARSTSMTPTTATSGCGTTPPQAEPELRVDNFANGSSVLFMDPYEVLPCVRTFETCVRQSGQRNLFGTRLAVEYMCEKPSRTHVSLCRSDEPSGDDASRLSLFDGQCLWPTSTRQRPNSSSTPTAVAISP